MFCIRVTKARFSGAYGIDGSSPQLNNLQAAVAVFLAGQVGVIVESIYIQAGRGVWLSPVISCAVNVTWLTSSCQSRTSTVTSACAPL
jgi:hypothetical protein